MIRRFLSWLSRVFARLGAQNTMASSHFYGICRRVDDNGTMRKSVELEVTLASGVEYTDHAAPDGAGSVEGEPVVWYVTFPNSDDYATALAGMCPQLPPAASDLFSFATRTFGGQLQVCDYEMPVNQTWLDSFMAYLAYWFPALHADVLANANLTPTMKRREIIDAVSQRINPLTPPVPPVGA